MWQNQENKRENNIFCTVIFYGLVVIKAQELQEIFTVLENLYYLLKIRELWL